MVKTEIWDILGSLEFPVVTRLCHFPKIFGNEILVDFFDFGSLDMLDNADYVSTNSSFSFNNHKLPGLRAKSCKIRLIT